jgi:methionyl-tRNA formyltransferase
MRIVFMGTASFAVPSFEAAVEAGHEVAAVVTQPDRPRGRGMALQPSAVRAAALERNLPVLQPEKASAEEFVDALRALAPEAIVVVAYGQILRQRVLDIPPLGCINVHGSLLPALRGAAPIQWAIINGLAETGVSTMFMERGMDTGDVIAEARTPIDPEDTASSLGERLAGMGAELLVPTLAEVQAGTAARRPQDSAFATYAPMLTKETGAVDWNEDAVAIRNRVHGCNPSPGAFCRRGVETIKLWRAKAIEDRSSERAGTVLETQPLLLAAEAGTLELLEVQPPNRTRMSGSEFARGYRVRRGEVWSPGYVE